MTSVSNRGIVTDVLDAPVIVEADGGFGFVWNGEMTGLAAKVTLLEDDRHGLDAEVWFTYYDRHILQRRFNLLTSQGQNTIAKTLRGRLGKPWNYEDIVEQLAILTVRAHRKTPVETNFDAVSFPEPGAMHLDTLGLLARNELNVPYGPGESGKGYWIVAYGLMVASGVPFAHVQPRLTGPVVYLDYEDNDTEMLVRKTALGRGMGISDSDKVPFHHYDLRGWPALHELRSWLVTEIKRLGAVLLIVDSYIPAAGRDPETAAAFGRLHGALMATRTTSCVITHVAKAEAGKRESTPWGSVQVMNLARSTLEFVRDGSDDEGRADGNDQERVLDIGIYKRKVNAGFRRSFGFSLRLELEGEPFTKTVRTATFQSSHVKTNAVLASHAGAKTRALAWLVEHDRGTTAEIATGISLKPDTVKQAIGRHPEAFLEISKGGGRSRESVWAARSNREEQVKP